MERDYEIRDELGRGAMGVVYRAYDRGLQREVALKVLKERPDPRALARFRLEGESAARVRHPNVLAVHDLVVPEQGPPYLVEDLALGGSLRDRIHGRGELSREEILAIFDPLLAGAEALHAAGIVHRDLKPENVLFAEDGRPQIADLGLARAVDRETRYTQSGVLTGTPAYMAPEQVSGGAIVPATDVYALGVILYELLTGELPFDAASLIEQIDALLKQAPTPPRRLRPSADPTLEAICLRCLAKDPAARYADAAALRAALAARLDRPAKPARLVWGAVIVSGALLAATGVAVFGRDEGSAKAPTLRRPTASSARPTPAPSASPELPARLALDATSFADTSALPGLEVRRAWGIRVTPEGLRLRAHRGDGPQLTLPLRFRRAPLEIRARIRVLSQSSRMRFRIALVPDRPINAAGVPGSPGLVSAALLVSENEAQARQGVRFLWRSTEGGRTEHQELYPDELQTSPSLIELSICLEERRIRFRLGSQEQVVDHSHAPGEYRLELGPAPRRYTPEDPSRTQVYQPWTARRLSRDELHHGYDLVLERLEVRAGEDARLLSLPRGDAWSAVGIASRAGVLGAGSEERFKRVAHDFKAPHAVDEATFWAGLLAAEASVPAGERTLHGLQMLYLARGGVGQTAWFDELGWSLDGPRLEAWGRAGKRINGLPDTAPELLALARMLLPLDGRGKRWHHPEACALYGLLEARRLGAAADLELAVAWLYNGDLERAAAGFRPLLEQAAPDPRALYFGGLTAYWRRDYVAARRAWSGLPSGYFLTDPERVRFARAERLSR